MAQNKSSVERVKTGIAGLDNMLEGGIIAGRNILLSGPAGSGKTTFGVQFLAEGIKSDENCLYVSLEENKKTIYDDSLNVGINLYKIEKTGKFYFIGGRYSKISYRMSKLKATAEHIMDEILEVISDKKITRLVLDSLNLLAMMEKDPFSRRELIAKLTHELSKQKTTSLLISETIEDNQLSTFGMEEFICDGVIRLYSIESNFKYFEGVRITKMRGTNHDKQIRKYKISDDGITVYSDEIMLLEV